MEKKEILGLSAVALASAIKEGKTTAPGAVQAVLEQIEETEKKYHCYVTIDAERAMKTAIDVQNKIKSGELSEESITFVKKSENEKSYDF